MFIAQVEEPQLLDAQMRLVLETGLGFQLLVLNESRKQGKNVY